MSKIFYILKKSILNILRRPLSALTSLLSILLLLLMLDFVWIAALSLNNYLGQLKEKIDMEIFIDDTLPDSTTTYILDSIKNIDGVAKIEYTSKEKAREKLLAMMGTDLLDGLDENPLPRSINLAFSGIYLNTQYLDNLEDNLYRLSGVTDIYFPRSWLEKIEYTSSLAFKITIFLSLTISLAVVLNLLHSLRLSVRTREDELKQMRLLGAGRIFLSIPFLIEGIFYAILAAAVGWLIILYGATYISFQSFEIILPRQEQIIYFCILTGFIGMICGYLGLRRTL